MIKDAVFQGDLEPLDNEMLRAYGYMTNFNVSYQEYLETPEYIIDYLLAIAEGQKMREKRKAESAKSKAQGKPLRTN